MSDRSSDLKSEPYSHSLDLPGLLRKIFWISIITVFVISLLDLFGWAYQITLLKSIMPQWIPMKRITAICFIFAAAGLVIIQFDLQATLRKMLPRILAISICLVSLFTLYVHLYIILIGHEPSLTSVPFYDFFLAYASRMAFLTASNFLLIGCVIFLLSLNKAKASDIAHVMTIPAALVTYFILVSYILNVYSATEIANVQVALNSGIAFCGICSAIILIRPDTWLLRIFLSGDTAGIIARRLLPPLMVLPIIIGWARIKGEQIGLYKSEEGVILVAMTYTVSFLMLIWLTARSVNKIDKRRHSSEEALKESHERMTILSEIAYQLLTNEDPQKLIKKACYRIMDFLDCQVFFNFLIDDDTGKLHLNSYAGISTESAKNTEWLDLGEAICRFVAANGEPIVVENIPETPDPRTDLIKSFGIITYACHPLLSFEKVIGTVSFGSTNRVHFSDDDLSLMKVFADQVATFIRRIKYEIALQESEERFRALAESSPVGMGVVGSLESEFLYVNPAYEEYFGYDKDELLNKKAPDIYWDPNDRELIYKRLAENNFVSNYEVKLKRKNGSSFWGMSSIRPIKFLNKQAFLGVFIDISKRKEAEEALIKSEQRLKYHFENSPLAVVEWNKDYYVIEWSFEAERIFGWKKEEVVGKRIDTLNMVYEEDIPILEKTMEQLSNGKESKVISSNRNYTRNREIRECVWYNSVLLNENGQMSSVMSLVDDVTEIRKVEKLLKESEVKLWSVLNATQESIYMFDREGRFTMANSTGLRRLNDISEQELIGRHFSEFMPAAQARQRQSNLDIVFKTGEPLEFEDARNGVMFHHNFFPLFNENGVSHVVTYSTDITLRKLAEKELQSTKDYLENLINYANAPIIVWNPDREIRLFNHAFERLTGYTSSEVDGKKIDLLFPKASLRESNIKIKAALIENWKTIEIPIQTKQGDIRTVLWNSANIYDADKKTVTSTIAQGNDITERIQAEQKVKERTKDLELANTKLQQELKERYLAQEALKKSEAQLKELNATKDKFFNIVAHDLKNPFTSLLGSSELLFSNIDQMDHEKIKTLSLILNDSAKNGYAILQNLLDWSRSQTGLLKFNPEKINLKKLITENIANLQLLATNKAIDLYSEVKDDTYIFADKNMINTILRNLLSNSIKFTKRGGKVVVSAIINKVEVIISVKDSGIGISKENINKLFRIDVKYSMPGTDNEQGTGLGLKLSREFVEKQGGKIWVESVENRGSDFKFTIPLKKN